MAIAASASASLRDRLVAALGARVVAIFLGLHFEDVDLVPDDDDDAGLVFFCGMASNRGGFAYTVRDRVFLVVERVVTGIVGLVERRL